MAKKRGRKFTGSQAGGRRKVRNDTNAVSTAFADSSKYFVIYLGMTYFKIWKDMVDEFQRSGAPISITQRESIIACHSKGKAKSNPSVVMCELRYKGALVSDIGDSHQDKDVVPRFKDVIIADSRSKRVLYPEMVAGIAVVETMSVDDVLKVLSSAKHDAPKASQPAPAPDPTQKHVAQIRTKEEIAIELEELKKQISKLVEQGKARKLEQAQQELQSLLAKIAEVNQTLLVLQEQETVLREKIHTIEYLSLTEEVLEDPSILEREARLQALLENYDTTVQLLVR